MHIHFYKNNFISFYFSTNKLRILFHSISVLKGLRLSTLHRILYGMFRSLSSLILASFILVTESSNCRRCVPPICIVASNYNKPVSLLLNSLHIFLIVSRKNYPRRFILFHLAIDRNITLTLFSF
jgi:hypothetical protein